MPKRLKRLRKDLIKCIPRVPNDRASRDHMEAKGLPEIVIDYLNWRSRYVGIRPRTATIEPAALVHPNWISRQYEIEQFLEKARQGEDLTPHLSLAPHTRGYTPASQQQGATVEEKWSDKDFILNTMGYHHFHLGTTKEAAGHASRTDEVIFARVTRDHFDAIAVFDHSVFELNSAERQRLWQLHDDIIFRGVAPGSVVMGNMIATSGHSLHVVTYGQHCLRYLRSTDPQLEGGDFMNDLYERAQFERPAKFKPIWCFRHLDLAIWDEPKRALFVMIKGWN
jgi:hypothetical protein